MNKLFATLAATIALASTASAQIYETDFTDDTGWTFTNAAFSQWAVDATPANHCAGAFRSAPSSLNMNNGTTIGSAIGTATSPPIDISSAQAPFLEFWISWDLFEPGCEWDAFTVIVVSTSDGTQRYFECMNNGGWQSCDWQVRNIPLDPSWGEIEVIIGYDEIDTLFNSGTGVFLDDLSVRDGGVGLFCSPAAEHFLGGSVTLEASGFAVSTMALHLEASGGPADQFGFFFMGPGFGPPFLVFNGIFCLSQPIGRYNLQVAQNQGMPTLNSLGQFDASGVMQNLSGTSSVGTGFDVPLVLPYAPGGQLIQPGDTWYFQFWYRDVDGAGNPTANYSDAVGATFN